MSIKNIISFQILNVECLPACSNLNSDKPEIIMKVNSVETMQWTISVPEEFRVSCLNLSENKSVALCNTPIGTTPAADTSRLFAFDVKVCKSKLSLRKKLF